MELRGADGRQCLLHKDTVRVKHVARGHSHFHVSLEGAEHGHESIVSAVHTTLCQDHSPRTEAWAYWEIVSAVHIKKTNLESYDTLGYNGAVRKINFELTSPKILSMSRPV